MEINYLYWVQVLAISGIFALFHYTCLRQNGHHSLNRLVLLSSMALSLLLPLIRIPVVLSSGFEVPFLAERAIVANTSPAESEAIGAIEVVQFNQSPFPYILSLILLLISAFFLLRLFLSVWMILKKVRISNSQRYPNCLVIFDEKTEQPYSFFKWVFLPAALQNDENMLNTILSHEATHARKWHSLDKLFTSTLKTVLWWNPFFIYLQKQLQLTHEYQADAAAAKQTGIKEYAAVLINHIFPGTASIITHSFFLSPIKSRIMMLLAPSKKTVFHWIFIPLIGLTVLFFSTSFKKTQLPVYPKGTFKVVVDAGHGGMDNGAGNAGWNEKDLTLALAKAIQQKALGTNISITMTRNEDELPVAGNINESLKKRVSILQETDAGAMISLHIGTAAETNGNEKGGVRAFIAGKNEENALVSKPLATALLNGLTGGPLYVHPDIQQRREQGVYILDKNSKPVVLLEVGFITSKKDLEVLSNTEGLNNLAERILKGLQQYAGIE
jgi:N-acetylmuramoyl-L-alanine amidase